MSLIILRARPLKLDDPDASSPYQGTASNPAIERHNNLDADAVE